MDPLPTRPSLIDGLKNPEDADRWDEFYATYSKFIYWLARKSNLTHSEAQEVVQETIIYVSRKMPGFNYDKARGSFKGWLTKLTRWRIADHVRKRDGHVVVFAPAEPGDPDPFLDLPDPSPPGRSLIDEEWEQNLLDSAIQRVKEKVNPVQFQIFELYALKQWPILKVTELLGISLGQAYLAKHRITALLRKDIRLLEHLEINEQTPCVKRCCCDPVDADTLTEV
jgi:RNA polymerase sigma-70 factor (ECF subfamily)